MIEEVEKIIAVPLVSSKVKRNKLDKAQNGINDKIPNDEKDSDKIELSTSKNTVQNDTNDEIHHHEIDKRPIVISKLETIKLYKDQSGINDKIHDEIELSTSDTVQNDTNVDIHDQETETRPIVFLKLESIKLDKAQSSIDDKTHNDEKDHDDIELSTSDAVQIDTNVKIHDHEIDLDEIEITTSEQWERVNDLLLLITTILIFNATSLIIAFFQITWKAEGTVFNRALVLQSQKIIGMSIL